MSRPKKIIQTNTKTLETPKPVVTITNNQITTTIEGQTTHRNIIQTLRGMKDILPADQKYWEFINDKLKNVADIYGYQKIVTPILENISLIKRAVGIDTDIVSKEIFNFTDKNGEEICLRPEGTASIARSYLEHGMVNETHPIKLYYNGPMYRHEKPQDQRYRQFHQFGFETIGDASPVMDAELIFLLTTFYNELGLTTTRLEINNIGCQVCRIGYKQHLFNYYKSKKYKICDTCNYRLTSNIFRVLDCKEEQCSPVKEKAPKFIDHICDDCQGFFIKLLEYLDEFKINYNLNSYLVRGLDYYTRTVFEIWSGNDTTGKNSLGGGGRYDYLIEELGGSSTPAVGYAGGLERLVNVLKAENISVPEINHSDIFFAHLGDTARRKLLPLVRTLHQNGIKVHYNLAKTQIRSQLDLANKLKVRFSIILGQKEAIDNTIILRDMDSGIQEIIDQKKLITELQHKLTSKHKDGDRKKHAKESKEVIA